MRSCDKKMIKTLIELGVNFFEPNSKGAYCIQIAMHSAIHISTMEACHIREFIAKVLSENKDKIWYDDPIIKEYIDSINKDGKFTSEQTRLFHEIKNQDIPRIKVLLALGYKPDERIPNLVSNLHYCAQNGLTEIAKLLLDNYCDPNRIDKNRHNTFWVAAINEHFETASLIHKYGVKLNVVDTTD